MRNAYVVVKDMIGLIPENEEDRFQILKHNLSKNILGSWAHAAPEKQYSMWPWNATEYYINFANITEKDFQEKDWLKQFHSIYVDPEYKIEQSHYKLYIKTNDDTKKMQEL